MTAAIAFMLLNLVFGAILATVFWQSRARRQDKLNRAWDRAQRAEGER